MASSGTRLRLVAGALVLVPAACNSSRTTVAQTAPASAVPSAAASPAASAAAPSKATYRGRAVYYLDATTPCPRVGVGSRSEHACIRVSLDDDKTTAEIDRERHRITFRNEASYDNEQIVGDVVLPGWSESDAGRTPVGVHTVFRKKGNELKTKVYSHVVVREKAKNVALEDYEIVFSDGKNETTVLTRAAAEKVVEDPSVAAKAAGFLFEMKDTLAKDGDAGSAGEKPVADITVAAGIGPAADKMLRAQLFKSGSDVELKFSALSHLVPAYIAQRDMFLYGVEAAPAVADVTKRGLKKGETVDIAFKGGKGTVKFGEKVSDLPDAPNSVRDFLQTAAVGMLLARQARLDGG
jgi:hypothetical protein